MLVSFAIMVNVLYTESNILHFISLQTLDVKMGKYVWLMELPPQEEWKFVSVVYGEQYVMIFGMMMMLELSADNLDLLIDVSTNII